jgi:Na+/H+-dicarboxylate symporter
MYMLYLMITNTKFNNHTIVRCFVMSYCLILRFCDVLDYILIFLIKLTHYNLLDIKHWYEITSKHIFFRAIAMPETLHSLEVTNKLDKRITRFVVPLSCTIGRSGTCLYINVSCLFVIQLVGLELTATRITLVW